MSFWRHLREPSHRHHQTNDTPSQAHLQNDISRSNPDNLSSQHQQRLSLNDEPTSLQAEVPTPTYTSSSVQQTHFPQRRTSSSSVATYSSNISVPPPYSETDPNQYQSRGRLTTTNRDPTQPRNAEGTLSHGANRDQPQLNASRATSGGETQTQTVSKQKKSKPKPTRVRRERLLVSNPMLYQLHKADIRDQAQKIREAKRAQAGEK